MSTPPTAPKSVLSDIAVVQVAAQPTLVVRTTCARAALGATLATVLPRVLEYALASGHAPAGPPFTRYLETNGDELVIEAGLPLAAFATGAGDIVASELPGGSAAMVVHSGPYEGLPEAHRALASWAEANGRRPSSLWEVYATDPSTQPDSQAWKTNVFLPIDR